MAFPRMKTDQEWANPDVLQKVPRCTRLDRYASSTAVHPVEKNGHHWTTSQRLLVVQ